MIRDYDPRLAKVAEALGWMRCERLGREVWYSPEGGHVGLDDLPEAIESDIAELCEHASWGLRRCKTCFYWKDLWDQERLGSCVKITHAEGEYDGCRVYVDSDPVTTGCNFGCKFWHPNTALMQTARTLNAT